MSYLLEPESEAPEVRPDNRRSIAIGIALVAFIGVLAVSLLYAHVPFTRFAPGPTYDVLGETSKGDPIIQVDGHETFPTDGQLRMVTVSSTGPQSRLSLFDVMRSWVTRDQDLYPTKAIYPEHQTNEESRQESALEMVTSQDLAVAAALKELGYDLTTYPMVAQLVPEGAAEGVLEEKDVLRSVNGTPVATVEALLTELKKLKPGDSVELGIERDGKPQTVTVTTKPAADDASRATIGIYPAMGYVFPFDVNITPDQGIGGPSAGTIFALALYDTLTPGELTGGKKIAGTGTIDGDGTVGSISGVRQKIAGAERDGASLFLVPKDNCDEAVKASTRLKVVPVSTLHDAIDVVGKYADDDLASLPRCSQ